MRQARSALAFNRHRFTLAVAAHFVTLGLALPVFAADAGELCVSLGGAWIEPCSEGLSCDTRWSFGILELGVCTDGEPMADSCGGLQGSECPVGQFCQFSVEQSCGAADQTGVCSVPPEVCTQEYAPVCGCDGETYGNDCAAHAAGTSAASLGECAG